MGQRSQRSNAIADWTLLPAAFVLFTTNGTIPKTQNRSSGEVAGWQLKRHENVVADKLSKSIKASLAGFSWVPQTNRGFASPEKK